jgi:hypothetical protein
MIGIPVGRMNVSPDSLKFANVCAKKFPFRRRACAYV